MNKKFREYKEFNLSQINKDILKFWEEDDTFHQSITTRAKGKPFIFYEGPPSANGQPGIHHVVSRAIKDIFCRYKTQQGFLVKRKAGWDTHGLPVELSVEKSLGITKEDIGKHISVADYNAACRREVMKYTDLWEDLTHKMGYWVNMDDPYITYDNRYIETLWWLLKSFYNKNLLYKGYTIQPYSPAAGTGLSSHELNQPGCYRDVKDTTCIAQFKVVRNEKSEYLFNKVVDRSLHSGLDNYALDAAFQHCAGSWSAYQIRQSSDFQSIYRRTGDCHSCQESFPSLFPGKKMKHYRLTVIPETGKIYLTYFLTNSLAIN